MMKALRPTFYYYLGILMAICLLALPGLAFSQITFDRVFGGNSTETAYKVEICDDGGFITVGYTRSYGPGFANMHIIRTDKYGFQMWDFVEGGNNVDRGYSIAVTKDGEFVAVGMTNSFGAGAEDIMVVKLDKNGNKLWRKTFGGSAADEGWDIRETSDGGFIITGFTNSWGATLFDAFLLKIDKHGNEQWKRIYGGNLFDGGYCVRQTTDGGYAFLGQTQSMGSIKGDFYFVKTDSQGNIEFTKTFGGTEEEEGRYFALTDDGGYILAGKSASPGSGALGDEDYYVIKLDAAGEVKWEKRYGGDKKDSAKSIEPTKDGGYIVTGSSRSFNWQTPRVWILKLDGNGNQKWAKNYGGWDHDHGHHIMPTDDGGYIATGHYNRDASKGEDTYLLKLDAQGNWNSNALDAGVTSLLTPYESDCASSNAKITFKARNTGNIVLHSIPATAKLTGGLNKTINQTFSHTLWPGQEATFTFSETVNTSGGANFKLEVSTNVANDVYANNNGVTKDISVSSNPAPIVNLGTDIHKNDGQPVELDAGAGFTSYKWSTGATTRKIMANNSELYWVEVKDNNGCRAVDSIFVAFTSVAEYDLHNSIKIFPNPTDGQIEISLNTTQNKPLQVRVFNFSGQLLHEEQVMPNGGSHKQQLNLKGYPAGIYLLNITNGSQMGTSKIIIR
jgi:hypothetical protein